MLELLSTEAARMFQQTREAAEGLGPDLIVGTSYHMAAPSVAELLGVPFRAVMYQPQGFVSSHWPPILVKSQTLPRWMNRLAWGFNQLVFQRSVLPLINRERGAWGLRPQKDALSHLQGERPLLASARALAPLAADVKGEPVHLGALVLPIDGQTLAPEVEAFLAAGEPPFYIGFGSMPSEDPEGTARMMVEAVRRAGARALIGAGWSGLNQGFEGARNILVVKDVPHALLFPQLRGVVHHGGAGTTFAVARAGVPQLVVPHAADQFFWGRQVHQLGLGPAPVPRPRLRVESLAAGLRELAGNPSLAQQAQRLAAELAQEEGAGERAVRELERQVEAYARTSSGAQERGKL
jgi:vancomycin aglycone glucosyltransferase